MYTFFSIYLLIGAVLVIGYHKMLEELAIEFQQEVSLEAGTPIPYWLAAIVVFLFIVVCWPYVVLPGKGKGQ